MRLWALILGLSFAEEPKGSTTDDDIEMSDTVSGRKVNILQIEDRTLGNVSYEDEMVGQYPKRVHNGAKWLDVTPEFMWHCWLVMNSLYERDYRGLHGVLENVKKKYPNSGVEPVGRALMYQTLMLENFDFKYETQYKTMFELSKQQLEQAMLSPGNDAWETFLLGAILGVDAIHELRKEEFLDAINQGFEAVKWIEKAKKLAPDFVDADLGDGLWLYWRSLIASNVPGFSSLGFADDRQKGIDLMLHAEKEAVFLRPAASHALTYTWIEEHKMKRALDTARRVEIAYPNNVINLQVLGRVEMYNKLYKDSEQTYAKVLELSPKNQRVHYYLARLYMKQKKYAKAEKKVDLYLKFDLDEYQEGYAHYYRGHILMRQKKYKKAAEAYDKAWKVNKVDGSKEKAERARKMDKKNKGK